MNDLVTHSIPRSVWHGWGDPAERPALGDEAWTELAARIGVDRSDVAPPVPIDEVRLRPSRLGEAPLAALAGAVGPEHVHTDRRWRIEHAGGKSYPDLYRLRTGDASQAPDAVVVPGSAAQVGEVLRVCEEHGVAVVPFGGGTSVVGGVGAVSDGASGPGRQRAVVTLDLRRLTRVVKVDPKSRLATLEAGLRGPEIEQSLHPHGLTLGHYPQSHQEATVGGYVATRSAGQASTGYGRVDDLVVGARVVTPRGELVLGGRAPASAAGPRLLDVVVGSEGTLGVITEATVRVAPLPTVKRHGAWFFPSFAVAATALRTLVQSVGHGGMPDVCRLSDEDETRVNLTLAGAMGQRLLRYTDLRGTSTPALLVLVWEGTDRSEVRHRRTAAGRVLSRCGGRRLPAQVSRAWERTRFSGPYLRDELMDRRVLADTLETATTWDNLPRLHTAARAAISGALEVEGRRAVVMCHVSHVYAAGASLYYTFLTAAAEDPLAQWRSVKTAASDTIIRAGGTITHHHAVGTDHRAHLAAEIGPLGVGILRALKEQLDPAGILNPGKLIPDLPPGPPGEETAPTAQHARAGA
ncbi:FAD-binding oxidoreductase [Intrasporangium calvum]|uniref:Alkylglycerone-phosphate synthase n=1 Tax=Intrasporangium calvum (strain ATCC 23552 / DSM 43043 / JCM 3097 / NBRC 12989 / NCIMB 10167 / NRRL B-3866 / 7 KIP) TaxID=710696 RepID=E6SCV4_INTC7|nr:FAD-binding oxidoreductase [Intrasporangium calvum]ADU47509.1 Alkylglycerone-phosphate synthase [Intrasporangium calvum DSM 43043]